MWTPYEEALRRFDPPDVGPLIDWTERVLFLTTATPRMRRAALRLGRLRLRRLERRWAKMIDDPYADPRAMANAVLACDLMLDELGRIVLGTEPTTRRPRHAAV